MRTDVASRVIAAPPDRVFGAFLDPDAFVRWLPPAGMTGSLERFDTVTGGGYLMRLVYDLPPDGGGKADAVSDVAEVTFVEIDPPHRIVESVAFPSTDPDGPAVMTMEWAFTPKAGGTEVIVRATDVPDTISPEDHTLGLASSLENLAAEVE
jgi:uncharacterized protein YndB with AHSA1/START domain